jgi:hypothetical protein
MTTDHDVHETPSPANTISFIPRLTLVLVLGSLGSAALWSLSKADEEAASTWASYRDTRCSQATSQSSDVGRQIWSCDRETYETAPDGTPIEFRVAALRQTFRAWWPARDGA